MPNIIFRCDAGNYPEIGTGHITRCINLANKLVKKNIVKKCEISFLTRNDKNYSLGKKILSNNNFNFYTKSNNLLESNSISEIKEIIKLDPDIIVIDRLKTSKKFINALKGKDCKVITFDDYGNGRRYADLSICAIFNDVEESLNLIKGYKYLILSSDKYVSKKTKVKIKNITATFGGYDARDLCGHFLKNLNKINENYKINILLGEVRNTKLNEYNKIIEKLNNNKKVKIYIKPKNFKELLSEADIGICSGGLTIFEFAALGVPTIGLPLYIHQLNTINNLSKLGVCLYGSNRMNLNNQVLNDQINKLTRDHNLRFKMSNKAKSIIDGKGIERVIKILEKFFIR